MPSVDGSTTTSSLLSTTTSRPGVGDVIAACASSCRYEPVDGAAPFRGDPPHPIVLLDRSGEASEWFESLPVKWRATEVGKVELVAVLGPAERVVVEVCHLEPGHEIVRYRLQRSVHLLEAATGTEMDSTWLTGGEPRQCDETEPLALLTIEGSGVTYSQLEEWLAPWVERSLRDVDAID
jgi:hypothetical protein